MKILTISLILTFILACNSNKNVAETSILNKTSQKNCPDDGECSFEVLKNKTFVIKKDEFGNSYSELLDGNTTVLKFEYKRNTPPDLQDANYSEVIYIEIENINEGLNLKDNKLSEANVGFSRLCFCRGQTGTYPVKSGTLNLKKTGNETFNLSLDFKVSEVPQIITSINETFNL